MGPKTLLSSVQFLGVREPAVTASQQRGGEGYFAAAEHRSCFVVHHRRLCRAPSADDQEELQASSSDVVTARDHGSTRTAGKPRSAARESGSTARERDGLSDDVITAYSIDVTAREPGSTVRELVFDGS